MVSLPPLTKASRVVILFQKDCSACTAQIHDLGCLKSDVEVVLVGLGPNENDLRKEYRKFNSPHIGLLGDREFIKSFKITSPITPQVIITKNNRKEHLLGLNSCSAIDKKLAKVDKL